MIEEKSKAIMKEKDNKEQNGALVPGRFAPGDLAAAFASS